MPRPLIVAHRGASHAQPENTAAAFDAALAQGAHGIELDLQLSGDGEVVVFHDATLARLGLGRRRVCDYPWSELAAMDVGAWFTGAPGPHRMLRLDDVLERWGHRTRLYLEIKNTEGRANRERHRLLAQKVADAVVAHGLAEHTAILSFHDRALADVAQRAPGLALVRNIGSPLALARVRRQVARLAAVDVDIERFGPAQSAALAALGVPLYAYTCDEPRHFRRAAALGVAAVIGNRPAEARRWYA